MCGANAGSAWLRNRFHGLAAHGHGDAGGYRWVERTVRVPVTEFIRIRRLDLCIMRRRALLLMSRGVWLQMMPRAVRVVVEFVVDVRVIAAGMDMKVESGMWSSDVGEEQGKRRERYAREV
jgi:hypothetical protein